LNASNRVASPDAERNAEAERGAELDAVGRRRRAHEWRRPLLAGVVGLLLFETLTGLSIYVLPFSVTNQISVIAHTLAGLAFIIPFGIYQWRHFQRYASGRLTHVQLTGYVSMAATVIAGGSGLVLTWQAALGTRISYGWDMVHVVATFAIIASVTPHVVMLIWYNRRAHNPEAHRVRAAVRSFSGRVVLAAAGFYGVVVVAWYAYRPVPLVSDLPQDYSYVFGEDRPFVPSLARTNTGGALDPRAMGGSESCGTSGCHEQILDEWSVSAHRYSAMDPAFRAVQTTMGEQNGPESTRYCAGCHDPISLFAGAKNLYREELTNPIGFDEGVSCVVCHSIQETDVLGNANYVVAQPDRYMFELRSGNAARLIRDFLIRAYPRQHVETLQHRMFKSPEFCAACHKQFIDEEINRVGWVQLQNQFDNWRTSRWNHPGEAQETIECRECHMPLMDSRDPAAGDALDYNRTYDDRKHRDHRFVASNQFVPLLLDLPGAQEHAARTEAWLQGRIDIPEIADKWMDGPAVPIELIVPERVAPGEEIKIQTVVTNNKVGHDFPTGPLDIIQAWVEVVVTDPSGQVVFASGRRDSAEFIQPGSFIFKAEPVDQYGNLIDRHNLWEMVGVRYRRSLFPGFSDRAEYAFACPGGILAGLPSASGPEVPDIELQAPPDPVSLTVSARLLYRKFDQFLLNYLFGSESGVTSPVTVISEDRRTIAVVPDGA
jgi:hypothetical protein